MSSRGADISECGKYRYRLWRQWFGFGSAKEVALFIMLNPSTADALQDDPTIRRCAGFANANGFERLEVVNLYAYRATDPKDLFKAVTDGEDAVGPRNEQAVREAADRADLIICAWGARGSRWGQDKIAKSWLKGHKLFALSTTLGGHPSHPLYLKGTVKPKRLET